jgi:hypothetical protein
MAVLDLHWRPQYVGSVPTAQELEWALHNKNVRFGSNSAIGAMTIGGRTCLNSRRR